jgi:hypothetical protein
MEKYIFIFLLVNANLSPLDQSVYLLENVANSTPPLFDQRPFLRCFALVRHQQQANQLWSLGIGIGVQYFKNLLQEISIFF